MAISKVKRGKVWDKSGGKCWYCGCDLNPSDWHIDHMKPKKKMYPPVDWRIPYAPDPNRGTDALSNLFPSCPDCNIQKSDMSLDDFRSHIENQVQHLLSKSQAFRLAVQYGVVAETMQEVSFWFERYKDGE